MSDRPQRILIAGTDEAARGLMQRALRAAGYEIIVATEGLDALDRYSALPCDMVLLDVALPGLDGYQVCERLRRTAGKELPILMVTDANDVASVERGFRAGATDFITKPVNSALIGHRVRHLFRGYRVLRELHVSERRLNDAQRIAGIGNWELDLVRDELTWSDEIFRIFEIDPVRFGASYEAFLDAIHPDDRDAVNAAYSRSLTTREPYEITHRLLMKDGRIKHVHERCETSFDADGRPLVSFGTVQDITERKLQELAVVAARNQLRDTLDAIPDLLFDVDLQGRCHHVHAPNQLLLLLPPEEIVGMTVHEMLPASQAAVCVAALAEAREHGASYGKQIVLTLPAGVRWFELAVSRKSATAEGATRFIVLARDITERKEAEHKVHRLAYFDTLTGLPNRSSFSERLQREIDRAQRHGEKLAVLFVDMDGFKTVNDTLGHDAGDLLLKWAAERMRLCLRPGDLVARAWQEDEGAVELARLGGDEFTALVPHLRHSEDVLRVAQRIREQMRRPYRLADREVVLTTSIGIALFPDDGADAASLMKYADTAMYHAKRNGRDNCQFYSAGLTREAVRRLDLESDLRLALERGEFYLEYQPQLDLGSCRVSSVEALIRWRHPQKGPVSPMEFIPLAEENGLIVPIGEWVIRTACSDAARWWAQGVPLRVAVNLSAAQFRGPDLVTGVETILAQSGLTAAMLELEVTEGVLMEDSDATLNTLCELRAMGVDLALDDFGTGYSSLSYLKRLPLSSIKVDRSFVGGLPDDRGSLAIVRAIVAMASNLGFTITAEGIETLAQARLLHELGCETLQGYFISRPVAAGQIPALAARARQLTAAIVASADDVAPLLRPDANGAAAGREASGEA